jgi:ABC-type branched-subunit amino acid transport system ATPase component
VTIRHLNLEGYLEEDLLSSPLWVRQAVILGVAVSSSSKILFLDEPLDGLAFEIIGDPAIEMIKRGASENRLIFLVTHNPELAVNTADYFVWVEQGMATIVNEDRMESEVSKKIEVWLQGV